MSLDSAADLTPLGERELDVMAVLWELGSGTVTEVLEHLGVPLAYTTVLTMLRNLEAKQYVTRQEEGRGHRYFPRVAQQAAQQNALARLVTSFFGGSAEALIARLVEQRDVSPDELARMARDLNRAARTDSVRTERARSDTTRAKAARSDTTLSPQQAPSPYKSEDDA
jgi:BlaI family transcriptional regulator, penicillinase repressor